MKYKSAFKEFINSIDLLLLSFLLFFTIDKVFIKPIALVCALLWIRKELSFKKLWQAPPFYLLIAALAAFNFLLINKDFSTPHLISFSIGICYWLMALLAFVVMKNQISKNNITKIDKTITLYFFINIAWSASNLVHIMYQSGSINPFNLPDEMYGNSTGDYIKGVFMAPCYINMFVNTLFALYFLYTGKYLYSILAIIVAFLTTSNFANMIFVPILFSCLFFIKNTKARITIIIQIVFFVLFYMFFSNGNVEYLKKSVMGKDDITETKALNDITKPSTTQRQTVSTKSAEKKESKTQQANTPIAKVSDTPYININQNNSFIFRYGKVIAFQQTYDFLGSNISNMLFGAGIGEFSSQLAVRTSDLPAKQKSRLFAKLPVYVSPYFYDNHYRGFYRIYMLPPQYHTIRHLPSSFANQLLGEYGLFGFILFIVGYLFYFLKEYKSLSYTTVMTVMICGFLLFDYLFEYLSVIVFFELFFLLDMKRKNNTAIDDK